MEFFDTAAVAISACKVCMHAVTGKGGTCQAAASQFVPIVRTLLLAVSVGPVTPIRSPDSKRSVDQGEILQMIMQAGPLDHVNLPPTPHCRQCIVII